jgi:hypothetical protein
MTSPVPEVERPGTLLSLSQGAVATMAIVLVSANFISPSTEIQLPPAAYISQNVTVDPFANATTVVKRRMDVAENSTDISASVSPRWGGYVYRRLSEILVGAHDFTGLKVPSDKVGRLAWDTAINFLSWDTPTPSVLPSEDGEILFVWHKAGWDIEISVGSEEAEVWAYNRRSGEEFMGSIRELRTAASRALSSLTV